MNIFLNFFIVNIFTSDGYQKTSRHKRQASNPILTDLNATGEASGRNTNHLVLFDSETLHNNAISSGQNQEVDMQFVNSLCNELSEIVPKFGNLDLNSYNNEIFEIASKIDWERKFTSPTRLDYSVYNGYDHSKETFIENLLETGCEKIEIIFDLWIKIIIDLDKLKRPTSYLKTLALRHENETFICDEITIIEKLEELIQIIYSIYEKICNKWINRTGAAAFFDNTNNSNDIKSYEEYKKYLIFLSDERHEQLRMLTISIIEKLLQNNRGVEYLLEIAKIKDSLSREEAGLFDDVRTIIDILL